MTTHPSTEILKSAILLEKRGRAFYETVAEQAKEPAVKEFFGQMAQEEVRHIQILAAQYREVTRNGRFTSLEKGGDTSVSTTVLSEDLKNRIASAGFESAAVSAAISMEERAVRLYGERAESAKDLEEKSLYRWLKEWETEHLRMLLEIDREITERIWNDNSFWPM